MKPYQFDFHDGGGLDLAFLSFADADAAGNVNVSRFGNRIVGPGGFINISQNARTMIYSGTFTAGKSEIAWTDGQIRIVRDGAHSKFVGEVQQITYSARYGSERGQRVLYLTERGVFQLNRDGLELIEIAPGADLERDVLSRMGFRPAVSPQLKTMDARLFRPEPLGLVGHLASGPRYALPAHLQATS